MACSSRCRLEVGGAEVPYYLLGLVPVRGLEGSWLIWFCFDRGFEWPSRDALCVALGMLCAWRARVEPVARRPLSMLDAAKPTVEDFDKVIDLLDDASATRSPH